MKAHQSQEPARSDSAAVDAPSPKASRPGALSRLRFTKISGAATIVTMVVGSLAGAAGFVLGNGLKRFPPDYDTRRSVVTDRLWLRSKKSLGGHGLQTLETTMVVGWPGVFIPNGPNPIVDETQIAAETDMLPTLTGCTVVPIFSVPQGLQVEVTKLAVKYESAIDGSTGILTETSPIKTGGIRWVEGTKHVLTDPFLLNFPVGENVRLTVLVDFESKGETFSAETDPIGVMFGSRNLLRVDFRRYEDGSQTVTTLVDGSSPGLDTGMATPTP